MSELTVRPATANDVELMASWAEAMAWETEHKRLDPATVHAGVAAGLADAAKARYFVAILQGVFMKGTGLDVLWMQVLFLVAYGALIFTIAVRKMRQKMA